MYMNRGCGLMVRIRPCQGCDGGSIPLVRSKRYNLIHISELVFLYLFLHTSKLNKIIIQYIK